MSFETRKIMPHFGLEISGINLNAEINDSDFELLLEHYYRSSMLLFRNQNLSAEAQARLAHRFGQPKIETRKQFNYQDHPEVSTLGNIRNDAGRPLSFFVDGGFGWHTDGSAACHVDAATFLYAVEVPREGGDTLFLSTTEAYDRAPESVKARLQEVSFLTSFHAHNDPLSESSPDSFIPLQPHEREALPVVWHKLVQTHPVTGKKLFYLSLDPLEFDGIDAAVAKQLIEEILQLASAPEYVYRHRWQPGELIIWDNHAMLHSGTPTLMYQDDRRLMHRSFVYTLPTERPLPNYAELSRIFMPDENSIRISDFSS